ncbi:hypothetical protein [Nonomuraea sp. NPDC052265]|uniref:hypothetical protein n=1 Tax=Nonomuraea sp. NPDC052265 TaxID=3364374 RepID=UPI0037CA938A
MRPAGRWAPFGLRARLGEQAWLGFDEDAATGQTFELGTDVLDAVGGQRHIHRQCQIAGGQRAAGRTEGGENLLVVGMIEAGQRRDRLDRVGVRFGEGQEGLAADPQVLNLLTEFA